MAAIVVPVYGGHVKKAKEKVCNVNCMQGERRYEMYLETEGIEHSDFVFEEFLKEYGKDVCPRYEDITYVDGKVKCSVHTIVDDEWDVPFL